MPLLQLATPGQGPFSDPDPLPPAPFLERYLFQDPIPTVVFFCLAAAIGWWWLQKVGKPKASLITAAACIGLAGLVLVLARFVVTEREALVVRCRELVNATLAERASEVEPILRSDATTQVKMLGELPRQRIIDMIKTKELTRRNVTEANLRWATATLDGPNVGRTQCRVQAHVHTSGYDGGIPSTWMIYWVRTDASAPWQVRRIEAQQIGFN